MDGMEARVKAIEFAIAILGPLEKSEIEAAEKQSGKVIEHYYWLAKPIRDTILFPEKFEDFCENKK